MCPAPRFGLPEGADELSPLPKTRRKLKTGWPILYGFRSASH
jgi:hypothetical protein